MTGLLSFDETAGGFHAGELIIMAGRPGSGKTAFAAQVASFVADGGKRALIVSLEMTAAEVATRAICGAAEINSRRIRTGQLTEAQLQRLEATADGLADNGCRIWAPASANAGQIRAVALQEKREGLSLLVVDYLQIVRGPEREQRDRVTAVSRDLKILAKELKIPVLALCQFNRKAAVEVPRLDHLAESGAIEQDADMVLGLHRTDDESGQTDLHVLKHRQGDIGVIPLSFAKRHTRFTDPQPPNYEKAFDCFNAH